MIKLSPHWAEKVRRVNDKLGEFRHIGNTLANIALAEKSVPATIAGGISILNSLVQTLVDTPSMTEWIEDQGYSIPQIDNMVSVCITNAIMNKAKFEKQEVFKTDKNIVQHLDYYDGDNILLYSIIENKKTIKTTIYIKSVESFITFIRKVIWSDNEDLELTIRHGTSATYEIALEPIGKLDPYIGPPSPNIYAKKVKNSEGLKSIGIIGHSGTGKTALARHIAREAGLSRFIKLGPNITKRIAKDSSNISILLDICKYMAPDVLLLDDVQALCKNEETDNLLDLLTYLNNTKSLLFLTFMDDPSDPISDLQGLRAGRINYWIVITPPSLAKTYEILKSYAPPDMVITDDMVKSLEAYPPAYLKQFIKLYKEASESEDAIHWRQVFCNLRYSISLITGTSKKNVIKSYRTIERSIEEIIDKIYIIPVSQFVSHGEMDIEMIYDQCNLYIKSGYANSLRDIPEVIPYLPAIPFYHLMNRILGINWQNYNEEFQAIYDKYIAHVPSEILDINWLNQRYDYYNELKWNNRIINYRKYIEKHGYQVGDPRVSHDPMSYSEFLDDDVDDDDHQDYENSE